MSNIKVIIHSFRLGDIDFKTNRNYFYAYSTPYFSGMLSVETEHWETPELIFDFHYDTETISIPACLNKINGFQPAYMKDEHYRKLIDGIKHHIKSNIEPLSVYNAFVNASIEQYKAEYKRIKTENPTLKPVQLNRKIHSCIVYTDHFDLSNVLGEFHVSQ